MAGVWQYQGRDPLAVASQLFEFFHLACICKYAISSLFPFNKATDHHSDCLIMSSDVLLFHVNVAIATHDQSSLLRDRLSTFCVILFSSYVAVHCCLVCCPALVYDCSHVLSDVWHDLEYIAVLTVPKGLYAFPRWNPGWTVPTCT